MGDNLCECECVSGQSPAQEAQGQQGVGGRRVACEVYSRVVGYYRPIRAWNKGAQQQHSERRMYDVPPETRRG